jgi:FAD/FMN-containing dehydrogenase
MNNSLGHDMAEPSMPNWSNWSGRLSSHADLVHVRSEDDVAALISAASFSGKTVRTAGRSHSHMPLIPNSDVIIDTSGLQGIISTDAVAKTAWVYAGTPIAALGRPLHDKGLALKNQGDIDRQTIGGAAATGTHGTGAKLQNISSSVIGARIVLASGEIVDCGPDDRSDLWRVSQLNLGAVGVVTRLKLQLRDAYRLRERGSIVPFDDVIGGLAEVSVATRHYEFFWLPDRDLVVAKAIHETDDAPEYPLEGEGKRVGWNYEVLPNHRAWKHTEMEYSVPIEQGPSCMAEIRGMVLSDFPDMPWAVEYRTLASDEVWMSTACERDTVTISLHHDVGEDETAMFAAAEGIFRQVNGRPHWAKVNYLDGQALSAMHPNWDDWWTLRNGVDPDGVFLNDYMSSIKP